MINYLDLAHMQSAQNQPTFRISLHHQADFRGQRAGYQPISVPDDF